ncbi:MAG: hypothetical protein EOO07_24880 [Chitinophagaceae bacterium]|nr:MAG: hypothetical protein EOO07_24880 [Chitinophagaceae bacterium]
MGYFGGLGAGKGWNTFNFILTPAEFELLFEDLQFNFVIDNQRVEIGYRQTNRDNIFNAYKRFFEETLIGEKERSKKEKWDIERLIRISIIDDLKKIEFDDIVDKKGGVSKEFKLVRPTEPVINISPFYITLTGTEKLSIAYMNDDGIIGLQLNYPKAVSWKVDNFSTVQDTKAFATSSLFDVLVKRIKNVSHKATVSSSEKTFKPNFWISKNAASLINSNRYLLSKNLTMA